MWVWDRSSNNNELLSISNDACNSTPESLYHGLYLYVQVGECIPFLGQEWFVDGDSTVSIMSHACRIHCGGIG